MNQQTEKVVAECLPQLVEQLHNIALNLKALAVMFHASLESKIEQVDFNSLPEDVQKAVLSQINPAEVQTGVVSDGVPQVEPENEPQPQTTGVNHEESVHDSLGIGASAQ